MKHLSLALIAMITMAAYAQDRFTLSVQTELADKNTHNTGFDYGFNIGVSIDYQRKIMYNNAEVYLFPQLNGMDYFHLQCTLVGFNHRSFNDRWRGYLGLLKGGFIVRENTFGPMVGSDAGVEHYITPRFLIGIETGYDWKMDDKAWDVNGTGHGVWFVAFKIGVTL